MTSPSLLGSSSKVHRKGSTNKRNRNEDLEYQKAETRAQLQCTSYHIQHGPHSPSPTIDPEGITTTTQPPTCVAPQAGSPVTSMTLIADVGAPHSPPLSKALVPIFIRSMNPYLCLDRQNWLDMVHPSPRQSRILPPCSLLPLDLQISATPSQRRRQTTNPTIATTTTIDPFFGNIAFRTCIGPHQLHANLGRRLQPSGPPSSPVALSALPSSHPLLTVAPL